MNHRTTNNKFDIKLVLISAAEIVVPAIFAGIISPYIPANPLGRFLGITSIIFLLLGIITYLLTGSFFYSMRNYRLKRKGKSMELMHFLFIWALCRWFYKPNILLPPA